MHVSFEGLHAEDVKAKLRKKFGSLRRFEQRYNIPCRSASAALIRPHRQAEIAISKALAISASLIWPSRYNQKTGLRLSRQPLANYRQNCRTGKGGL